MLTREIEYVVDGTTFIGTFAVDPAWTGPRPGVLLAPEGMGLGDLCRSFGQRLASLGYATFAMDYYGGGVPLADMNDAMPRITALTASPAPIRAIAKTALGVLESQPETDRSRLAAIGYCFGGTTVLELARSGAEVHAVVGFHSGLGTQLPAQKGVVKAKILAQLGVNDPIITAADRNAFEAEMEAAGVDWRINLYGEAGHSFTNPDVGRMGRSGFDYHQPTDHRSWRAMLDHFDEVLGPPLR